MSKFLLAGVVFFSLARALFAEDAIDERKVFDSFTVGKLLFIYERDQFDGDPPKGTSLDDVIKPAAALDQADPFYGDTEELVDLALKLEWTHSPPQKFDFVSMEVRDIGKDSCFWSVTWWINQVSGGMTGGPPPQYRAWLTGDGKVVPPHIYLWDFGFFDDGQHIRSTLPLSSVAVEPSAHILFGDEIRIKAVECLADFMNNQKPEVRGDPDSDHERRADWRFHSQELIELPDDGKAWSVTFINANFLKDEQSGEEYSPNDLPRFRIWVTEDGRLGTLTLIDGDDDDPLSR